MKWQAALCERSAWCASTANVGLNELALLTLRWQRVPARGTFFALTPGSVLLGSRFGAAVGSVPGQFPARRAAQLDPVEAFRHE